MKKVLRKCLAALMGCAMLTTLTHTALPVKAAEEKPVLLALGDECLMSPNGETTSTAYLAECIGAELKTYVRKSMKAEQLAEELRTNADLQALVAEADYIVLSIGVNDLVMPLLYEENNYFDPTPYKTIYDLCSMTINYSMLQLNQMHTEMSMEMPDRTKEAISYISDAVTELKNRMGDAQLIIQRINNPLAVDFKSLNVSNNRTYAVRKLYDLFGASLKGGAYNSKVTIEKGINQYFEELPDVYLTDIYLPVDGEEGETAIGFYMTDMYNMSMDYSAMGHICSAAAMLVADPDLPVSAPTVVTDAYLATGEKPKLGTMRPQLHYTIVNADRSIPDMGDIAQNGEIDTDDAYQMLAYFSASGSGIADESFPVLSGDLDVDDKVDTQDAYLTLSYFSYKGSGGEMDLENWYHSYLREKQAEAAAQTGETA